MVRRKMTGAYEWGGTFVNITLGCGNGGCRYCYGREMASRFKFYKAENWSTPKIRENEVNRKRPKYRKQPVFFQTTSDITHHNLVDCIVVLHKLLEAGNKVLIVSKPRWICITAICDTLKKLHKRKYMDQLEFRFTIGSASDEILKFWEPGASLFDERRACLQYAFNCGFETSVSCEPYLDPYVEYVYRSCYDFVSDSFWIGKMNQIKKRVSLEGLAQEQIKKYIKPLDYLYSDEFVLNMVKQFKNRPLIKFKDSIRKVMGK